MSQHSFSRALIELTSFAVIVSIVVYRRRKREEKASEERLHQTNKAVEKVENLSVAMFDYSDSASSKLIIDLANQRAKRWMSLRVSNAQYMVGQVGGKSHRKRPILILDAFVMKPVNPDHRGIREVAFYEAIQAASKRSGFKTYCSVFGPKICDEKTKEAQIEKETKLLHRLEPFTARYFGTIEYNQNQPLHDEKATKKTNLGPFDTSLNSYILLNNVTKTFSKPCVLDIKLGTETFEPDAPEDKKLYELNKYPRQSDFGFRLTAMRVYNPLSEKADECGYVYYPKQFGRSLGTRESLKQAMTIFFGGSNLSKEIRDNRGAAIQRILSRLKLIKGWFRDNKSFAFYGSSILIIYEGDTEHNEDMGRAKMIDFGRVRRKIGGDFGYLKGLTTLIGLLEEILKESFLETSKYIVAER